MKIFVTGGAGFIGSNFCDLLLKQRNLEKLCILDKFTYAGLELNLEEAIKDSRTSLIRGDICNASSYKDEILDSDIVINFAAESHVDNSIDSPEEFVRTNVFGTFQLLEVVRKSDKPIRYVQISTDEVYGSLSLTDSSANESSPIIPSSPYSASKAGADHLVMSYFKTYGLDVVITRSSNNYGPRQLPEKFIPKIISNAFENEKIPVYGSGNNIRDWIYVDDNCNGILKAAIEGISGGVYHFASNIELNNLSLAKHILSNMKKPEELIEFVTDRLGHDLRYSLETRKTQMELNWKIQNNLQTGLNKTINWYKDHPEWTKTALIKLNKR
ncbi:MAG: dTDP-glucose 4,6-dehydratase [Bdellovibrionaceae bacterium]|nr:dTDP-glucose 4,6-dehydratase [Pseudobdellovibrionaceae bacterium]